MRIRKVKHGHNRKGKSTKEYLAWKSMLNRCNNPNNKNYAEYGGRGIIVCSEWQGNFTQFLDDVGISPGKDYSLDRINTNGNYEPENVKWATWKEQQNNKRSNRFITFREITKTMTQWEDSLSFPKGTLNNRINKLQWPIERALTEPHGPSLLEYDNKKLTRAQWDKEKGFLPNTVKRRLLRGWSIDRALTTPVHKTE